MEGGGTVEWEESDWKGKQRDRHVLIFVLKVMCLFGKNIKSYKEPNALVQGGVDRALEEEEWK